MFSNDILWFLWAIGFYAIGLFMYKFFRKEGLYAMIVIDIILCNIQVMKLIPIFDMTATLGNVMFGNIFWVTGMLAEIYGSKEAKKGVALAVVTLAITVLSMDITMLFKPADIDTMHKPISEIFTFMHRVALASAVALISSQFYEVWFYILLKKKSDGKNLWLRSNFSLMLANVLDTTIFTVGAFGWLYDTKYLLHIALTTFIMKMLLGIMNTPFLYWGKNIAISTGEYFSSNKSTQA